MIPPGKATARSPIEFSPELLITSLLVFNVDAHHGESTSGNPSVVAAVLRYVRPFRNASTSSSRYKMRRGLARTNLGPVPRTRHSRSVCGLMHILLAASLDLRYLMAMVSRPLFTRSPGYRGYG